MKSSNWIVRGVVALLGVFAYVSAAAQAYPVKPIKIVVPFAPGGSSEIIARSVAQKLSEQLGQQVIVDNRPGGAGNIGMQEVARADPDGYTLILGHVGTLAMNPAMFKKLPYDPVREFTPISLLAVVPNIFVVHKDVPVKDFREFLALSKAKPDLLNYGTAGVGSAGHLAFEYLKMATGASVTHVPYKGTGPMLQDLLAGRVQSTSAGTPPLLPHIKAGTLRPIAVGSRRRVSSLPDVPTVQELGYPGFETTQWYGLLAPARTPEAVIRRLQEEIVKALHSKEVQERYAADGTLAVGNTPAEFGEFIQSEMTRWGEVVRAAGVKPE
jgi:tripartite-type tricarboxylate transporter receptor subunit TctC